MHEKFNLHLFCNNFISAQNINNNNSNNNLTCKRKTRIQNVNNRSHDEGLPTDRTLMRQGVWI